MPIDGIRPAIADRDGLGFGKDRMYRQDRCDDAVAVEYGLERVFVSATDRIYMRPYSIRTAAAKTDILSSHKNRMHDQVGGNDTIAVENGFQCINIDPCSCMHMSSYNNRGTVADSDVLCF